jgi:hypothetical protein
LLHLLGVLLFGLGALFCCLTLRLSLLRLLLCGLGLVLSLPGAFVGFLPLAFQLGLILSS